MLTRRWNRIANLRLLTFLLGAGLAGWGLWEREIAAVVGGALLLVAFAFLASYHGRLSRRRQRAATLAQINDEAALRVERAWDDLPVRHRVRTPAALEPDEPPHPFADDLNLFGRASLAQLLDTPSTPMGEATLARWLLEPADPATIAARQPAVAELAAGLELRQELEARGRLRPDETPDPEPFLSWAEGGERLVVPWLRLVAIALPLLLWALVAVQVLGLIIVPLWVAPLGATILLSQTVGRRAHAGLRAVAAQEGALHGYAGQLALLAETPFSAPLLVSLQERLGLGDEPADRRLRRLHRLAGLVIPAGSLAYGPIQAATLWDIHLLGALEQWRVRSGTHARDWLAALGEAEALAALAVPKHDNPDWFFPTIDPTATVVAAKNLGHPLLASAVRVGNNIEVGPPGTVLLVTGSNMSGKSTLLRAIGINTVLAQAGGPVCAAALRLPPVAVYTSMQVHDSLARGVSYFMAELQRLKGVVDAADASAGGDRRLLFLLDEILHGTNTAERQIAARRIVRHLVGTGAIGALSTHDLGLADAPDIAPIAVPVHFQETVHPEGDGPPMSFDYRLRPGVATSTNALRLMALVGLDLAEGDQAVGVAAGVVSNAAVQPASSTSSGRAKTS